MAYADRNYHIKSWCALAQIGRTTLYKYWKRGTGPSYVQEGRRRFITEPPEDWRHRVSSGAHP
jgi:predicted site-specific integrase-resolvase